MAIRKIVKIGDESLRKTCRKQEKFDIRLSILLKDMEESFRHKFASKPQVVEGNLKALKMSMDQVKVAPAPARGSKLNAARRG